MSNALILSLPISMKYRLTLSFRFFYLIFLLLIPLLVFYIFQINSVVSGSYQFQRYQRITDELTGENKFLEVSSANINSLENVDGRVQELGFEKIDKIHYIQIIEGSAVTKK